MTLRHVILRALLVLTLVWTGVWAVRAYAESKKLTAERVAGIVAKADFADWSDRAAPPDNADAQRRESQLREIARLVNLLDFQERDAHRRKHTDAALCGKLSAREKALYLDLTVMESFRRFMRSLDGMRPQQRKRFIEQGLREFAQGGGDDELARARALGADTLTKASPDAVRAYLAGASTDTILNLAPLIEVVNETVQGLRGNDFGPRHEP